MLLINELKVRDPSRMKLLKIQDDVGKRKSKYKLLVSQARLGSKRILLVIRTVSSGITFQESNGLKTLVCFKVKLGSFIEKIRTMPVVEGESVTDTKAHLLLHPYEREKSCLVIQGTACSNYGEKIRGIVETGRAECWRKRFRPRLQ